MHLSSYIFRLHRVHEMQTIVTDYPGVCLSVSLSVMLLHCVGSFSAAFAKALWPLVHHLTPNVHNYNELQ